MFLSGLSAQAHARRLDRDRPASGRGCCARRAGSRARAAQAQLRAFLFYEVGERTSTRAQRASSLRKTTPAAERGAGAGGPDSGGEEATRRKSVGEDVARRDEQRGERASRGRWRRRASWPRRSRVSPACARSPARAGRKRRRRKRRLATTPSAARAASGRRRRGRRRAVLESPELRGRAGADGSP